MRKEKKYLHYGHQDIDEADIKSVLNVLKSDFLTTGPEVEKFESEISRYTGSKYTVVCSSGSTALVLACMAIGIKKDSVVFVPSITFAASANAAKVLGAKIIFCDCCPESGLVLPEDLKIAIKNVKFKEAFFIGVHMNGQCINLEEISKLCKKFNIRIIEDASHALGTIHKSKNGKLSKIGSCFYSDLTVFSFHPVKTITMGEGGAVTTNNKKFYDLLKLYRNNGIERNYKKFKNKNLSKDSEGNLDQSYYELHDVGFNFRASDIHCALGRSQLRKLDSFIETRKKLVRLYNSLFEEQVKIIKPVKQFACSKTSYHLYVVLIKFSMLKISKARMMKILKHEKIGSMVHYIPLHLQPFYNSKKQLSGSESYFRDCLSLPLHTKMTFSDVKFVVEKVKKILTKNILK